MEYLLVCGIILGSFFLTVAIYKIVGFIFKTDAFDDLGIYSSGGWIALLHIFTWGFLSVFLGNLFGIG